MASRRRSRRNPAADKGLMGGMDTQSMLVGAVIGGAAVYFLTKKDTAPGNEAYLPAGAAGIERYQKAQMYKSGPQTLSLTPPPLDEDLCTIGGVTVAEMRRRIGVPGRVEILGTSDFYGFGSGKLRYWLARVDGREVVLRPDGTFDSRSTARRDEGRSVPVRALVSGSWAEDHLCDTLGTIAHATPSQFVRVPSRFATTAERDAFIAAHPESRDVAMSRPVGPGKASPYGRSELHGKKQSF